MSNIYTAKEIREYLNIGLFQVRKIARKLEICRTSEWNGNKTEFTDAQAAQIKQYLHDVRMSFIADKRKALPVKEVAEKLCMAVSTCYKWLKDRGLQTLKEERISKKGTKYTKGLGVSNDKLCLVLYKSAYPKTNEEKVYYGNKEKVGVQTKNTANKRTTNKVATKSAEKTKMEAKAMKENTQDTKQILVPIFPKLKSLEDTKERSKYMETPKGFWSSHYGEETVEDLFAILEDESND